jgi:hypothetical protein
MIRRSVCMGGGAGPLGRLRCPVGGKRPARVATSFVLMLTQTCCAGSNIQTSCIIYGTRLLSYSAISCYTSATDFCTTRHVLQLDRRTAASTRSLSSKRNTVNTGTAPAVQSDSTSTKRAAQRVSRADYNEEQAAGKTSYSGSRAKQGWVGTVRPWNSRGIVKHPSGDVEEGQWVNGRLTGHAKRTYPDGSTWEGEFRKGKVLCGHGVLKHEEGTVEEGQWEEGKLTGHCKRTYADGRSLEGEFREGRQWNALGVLHHLDGTVEEGQWVHGKLSGLGKRTYTDGRTLEGEFSEGRIQNGQGVLRQRDGTVEEGQWVEGKLTGPCRKTFREGRVMEGEFVKGERLQVESSLE